MSKVWFAASRRQRASGKSALENKQINDIMLTYLLTYIYLKVRKSIHHCRVLWRTEGIWSCIQPNSPILTGLQFSDTSLTIPNSTNTWNNFLPLWDNIKDSSAKERINVWCLLLVVVLLPVISSVSPNPCCLNSFGLNHRFWCFGEISPHLLFYICICPSQC